MGRKSDPSRGSWRERNAARAHELVTEEENQVSESQATLHSDAKVANRDA